MRVIVSYEINETHIKQLAEEMCELKEYEGNEKCWIEDHFEEVLDECQYFYSVEGIS